VYLRPVNPHSYALIPEVYGNANFETKTREAIKISELTYQSNFVGVFVCVFEKSVHQIHAM
jgi:hypothetical protein